MRSPDHGFAAAFRFGFLDLLWGIGLGLILRMVQGWLSVAAGGSGALPSYPSIGGSLPSGGTDEAASAL